MKLHMSRRSVYVGTIVAMVAMIGGFATAAAITGFSSNSVSGANSGTVLAPGNTIYNGGFSVALVASTAPSGGCQNSQSIAGTGNPETDNVYISGAAGSSCPAGTSEWYEEFAFVQVTGSLSNDKDTLTFVTTINGNSPATVTSAFTLTLSGTCATENLNVFVDTGVAATATPIGFNSVVVTASGS
jgi:hypothetical protein